MRFFRLIGFLFLFSFLFCFQSAALSSPTEDILQAHIPTLHEIQRWKTSQQAEINALLLRRLDNLENDPEAIGIEWIRKTRDILRSGRSPTLLDVRGGSASLTEAIASYMEDRHALEQEADQRFAKVQQGIQQDIRQLATEAEAKGDATIAQSYREESSQWSLEKVRGVAASTLSPSSPPTATTPATPTPEPLRFSNQPQAHSLIVQPAPGQSRIFSPRQALQLNIAYYHATMGRALIRARPYFTDDRAHPFSNSRTIVGEGPGTLTLEIGSQSPGALAFVIVQMIDPVTGDVLCEKRLDLQVAWQ